MNEKKKTILERLAEQTDTNDLAGEIDSTTADQEAIDIYNQIFDEELKKIIESQ